MNANASDSPSALAAWIFPASALAVGGLAFAYLVLGLGLSPDAPTIAMAAVVVLLMIALRQLFLVVYALGFDSAELWVEAVDLSGGAASETRAEYRRVLRAIKQLDEDHEVGKLGDGDHRSLREDLTLKAVELKRQLKAAEGSTELHPELAARVHGDDEDAVTTSAPGPVCEACQLQNDDDARFCKGCGATLTDERVGDAATPQATDAGDDVREEASA